MKNKQMKTIVGMVLVLVITIGAVATAGADTLYRKCDFEDGVIDWETNKNCGMEVKSENGNQYASFSYVPGGSTQTYYEAWNDFGSIFGISQIDFDIKFSDAMKENIYIRKRGLNIKENAVRIYKEYYNVFYATEGKIVRLIPEAIDYNKWYHFSIYINTSGAKVQNIVVTERDSKRKVGEIKNLPLNVDVDIINQICIGSDKTMCLDNLEVYKKYAMPGPDNILYLQGESYPKAGGTYQYTAYGEINGNELPLSEIKWSLKKKIDGVRIDESTGALTVDKNADVCPVVIVAKGAQNTKYYLVDVEK